MSELLTCGGIDFAPGRGYLAFCDEHKWRPPRRDTSERGARKLLDEHRAQAAKLARWE